MLRAGDVQRMRAAAGIEHSEMPHGDAPCRFVQLWRNLPRARKMEPAAYADLRAEDIPTRDAGASAARVIAGASGGVRAPPQPRARPPGEQDDDDDDDATVLDIAMEPGARFATELRAGDNAFLYVLEGALAAAGANEARVPAEGVAHAPPATAEAAGGADAPSELALRAGDAGALRGPPARRACRRERPVRDVLSGGDPRRLLRLPAGALLEGSPRL